MKKAVFLDRDGILVEEIQGEAPTKAKDLRLIKEVFPLLKFLKKFGYILIVVSNQPDYALGIITKKDSVSLKKHFVENIKRFNLQVDAIFYCDHHPKGKIKSLAISCDCRKPKPGLLLKAAEKYNIDLKSSYILGDRASDIKAGELVGCQTILFDAKNTQGKFLKINQVKPDYKVNKFEEVYNIISPQAFVLAGGRGERMMPLSKNSPKPLIKIAKEPMIDYILNLVSFHGFKKIGINLFYQGEKIKRYLKDGSKFGINITYIKEKELTGTAGAVKNIAKILNPSLPFFVISSDMMINFDLKRIYDFHLKKGGIATVCCFFREKSKLVAGKSGVVAFDKKTRRIKKFIERPKTPEEIVSQWVNSSIYVFNPKILKYIPNSLHGSKIIDLPKDIFPVLFDNNEKMYAYPVNRKRFYQLGIDTPDRIKRAEEDIINKRFIPTLIN